MLPISFMPMYVWTELVDRSPYDWLSLLSIEARRWHNHTITTQSSRTWPSKYLEKDTLMFPYLGRLPFLD